MIDECVSLLSPSRCFVALLQWAFVWVIFPLLYLVACSGRSLEAWSCWAYPCTRSLSGSCCCYCCRSASSLGCRLGGTALESPLPHCVDQERSQLKTNPGAPSIKYKGICTILKEIHGNFEVHISNFSFYRGARAPGKANVASPLALMLWAPAGGGATSRCCSSD
jgi:hypothetical protein